MVEWSEVRADRIIQLSQSAFFRVVYLPDQVGLERRFKGILAQRPRTLGRIDLLAGDGLKVVDTHHPDSAAVSVVNRQPFRPFLQGWPQGAQGMNMALRQFPRQAVRKSYRLYEVVVMSGTFYIPHLDYAPLKGKMSSRNREFSVNSKKPLLSKRLSKKYVSILLAFCGTVGYTISRRSVI